MTVCVQTLQPRISMEDYDTSDVELASTSLAAGADSMRKRYRNARESSAWAYLVHGDYLAADIVLASSPDIL